MVQVVFAGAEEILPRCHPADFVEKRFRRQDAFADEVHEFFQPLDLGGFRRAGRGLGFPEFADIGQDIATRRAG